MNEDGPSLKGIGILFLVALIVFGLFMLRLSQDSIFGMYQPGANAFAFKDWYPAPTLTPDQIALYQRCPELRYDRNAICTEEMLDTASSIFMAIWPVFAIGLVGLFLLGALAKGYQTIKKSQKRS